MLITLILFLIIRINLVTKKIIFFIKSLMLSMKTLKNMSVTKKIESVAKKDTDTPTNIKM